MAQPTTLQATYISPTNPPFKTTYPLSPPSNPLTPTSKTTYLSTLRKTIITLQEEINKELTRRMEEDKIKVTGEGEKGKGDKDVDEMEEDNYGEEVVDED